MQETNNTFRLSEMYKFASLFPSLLSNVVRLVSSEAQADASFWCRKEKHSRHHEDPRADRERPSRPSSHIDHRPHEASARRSPAPGSPQEARSALALIASLSIFSRSRMLISDGRSSIQNFVERHATCL